MKILAIETATEQCSAALLLDGQLLEKSCHAPRQHAERLLPMVESILAEAQISLGNVDYLAFGRGPGSFIGVRIATAAAQGLAFAADIPVVPVSSLAAIAQASDRNASLVALDARMGQLYWGAYRRDEQSRLSVCVEDQLSYPDSIKPPVSLLSPWYAIGAGWRQYDTILDQWKDDVVYEKSYAFPSAGAVALVAEQSVAQGVHFNPQEILPLYIRDDVAKKPASR